MYSNSQKGMYLIMYKDLKEKVQLTNNILKSQDKLIRDDARVIHQQRRLINYLSDDKPFSDDELHSTSNKQLDKELGDVPLNKKDNDEINSLVKFMKNYSKHISKKEQLKAELESNQSAIKMNKTFLDNNIKIIDKGRKIIRSKMM